MSGSLSHVEPPRYVEYSSSDPSALSREMNTSPVSSAAAYTVRASVGSTAKYEKAVLLGPVGCQDAPPSSLIQLVPLEPVATYSVDGLLAAIATCRTDADHRGSTGNHSAPPDIV